MPLRHFSCCRGSIGLGSSNLTQQEELGVLQAMRCVLDVTILILICLLVPVTVHGDQNTIGCQTGTPGMPVEQFRTLAGQGTFELWPPGLRPADPIGQALPESRDSTLFTSASNQLPGAGGLEFFYDLDILEDGSSVYLYMAFNSGFQILDITGANATSPSLRSVRNGWFGDFHAFEDPPTEFYFAIWDIDAIDPAGQPGETLVALAAEGPVGPTIWDAANKNSPAQLYQDTGKIAIQVSAANIGGRTYGFFAANNGVHVYDMTRAREVGPCFENTNTATSLCGGAANPVWRGRIEPWPWGKTQFVDVLEKEIAGQTRHFIAFSDGFVSNPLRTEIREITAAASLPPSSTTLVSGLSTISFGVELFEIEGSTFLGVVNQDDLEIHDVTPCLMGTPGCSLNSPVIDLPTNSGPLPDFAYVHYSESNGKPFLYKGFHTLCSSPPGVSEANQEYLLDLSNLASDGTVLDVRGEEYLDPTHMGPRRRIDYWSSYYDGSTGGFSTFAPHGGLFYGDYFYRAAQTLFDIHELNETAPPSALIEATSADRWLSTVGQEQWVDLNGVCNVGDGTDWSWSAANISGTPPSDPQPIVEALGGSLARVRRGLCPQSQSNYPEDICPPGALQVQADTICAGTPVTSDPLFLTLEDPRPFFDQLEIVETPDVIGPPPEFSVGQELTFRALFENENRIAGRPVTDFVWSVRSVAGVGGVNCALSSTAEEGVACTGSSLSWDTEGVTFGDLALIFRDGFESGDTAAWVDKTATGVNPGVAFSVSLSVVNEHAMFDGPRIQFILNQ